MMIRIKIRLQTRQADAKLLRFEQGVDFDLLTKKIATKLGAIAQEGESPHGGNKDSNVFELYLGGDALVEDTSEIDDGDDLVLKVVDSNSGAPAIQEDESSGTEEEDASAREKDIRGVVNPWNYVDMRIAKYFEVDGQEDEMLYFGNVVKYHPSQDEEGEWKVKYDDGDVEYYDLQEVETLEALIQLAKKNKLLDNVSSKSLSSAGEDCDDSSVEDVTDEILEDRQKQAAADAIDVDSISDEGYDDTTESDADDEDYESHADDLTSSDDAEYDECYGVKKRKAKGSPNTKRKRAFKPKDPPLEVLMQEKDVPAAPGKHAFNINQTANPGGHGGRQEAFGNNSRDQAAKNRIMKLLNTGFHANSNENEAKNAMRLAQRLMRKYNLSQAALLKERDANGRVGGNEVLKGGLVEVKIVNRKTRKPSQFARWLRLLTIPVAKNFEVRRFHSVSRGRNCSVTFYGVYTNCQLAAYAFRIATERISQMAAEYEPVKHISISTKSSKLSYALGIVRGIEEEVDATIQSEKERRDRKLVRARLASSRGEAYEESDDEDAEDDAGFSFVSSSPVANCENGNAKVSHDKDGKKDATVAPANTDGSASSLPTTPQQPVASVSLSGEALDRRLKEMEDEQQNSLVLVNHRRKIEKAVLKKHRIRLKASRARRPPITFDKASYDKGIKDSKEIDINQRAIREEVKEKKEKKR